MSVIYVNPQDVTPREIYPGVRQRVLWQGANGARAQILEIDAGARFLKLDEEYAALMIRVVLGTLYVSHPLLMGSIFGLDHAAHYLASIALPASAGAARERHPGAAAEGRPRRAGP